MTSPLISVLIPVYREGAILRQTIESVLAQTFKDFEVVLVENNADDESLGILKHYAKEFPHIVRLVSQPIQGAPSARNKGLEESRGRYIAMLEGDDLMYPNRLERQLECFEGSKEKISLLSSCFELMDWGGKTVGRWDAKKKNWMIDLEIPNIFDSHPSTWFFEKETALAVGMFNEAFNPRLIEDDEFNFKMFFEGKLLFIPENLIRVRLPSPNYQVIKDSQVSTVHILKKLDLFFGILRDKLRSQNIIKFNKNGFRKIRSQWLREQGAGFMAYENGKEVARKFMLEALKERKFDYKNWKVYFRSYSRKPKIKEVNGKKIFLSETDIDYLIKKDFFSLS